MTSKKPEYLIIAQNKAEFIGRDRDGLLISVKREHLSKLTEDWIELYIKNDSDFGRSMRK